MKRVGSTGRDPQVPRWAADGPHLSGRHARARNRGDSRCCHPRPLKVQLCRPYEDAVVLAPYYGA